jgi:hypothetical protein
MNLLNKTGVDGLMLSSAWDRKNSVIKKIVDDDRVDPGTFSLLEPGWWALHATAIAGIYMLGRKLGSRY